MDDPLYSPKTDILLVETIDPGARRVISENVRKSANTLAVGHGAALLFIFNASANDSLPNSVKWVAWAFAVGLIFAFMMQRAVFAFEQTDLRATSISYTEQQKRAELKLHTAHGSTCYSVSAIAFVVGLIAAISFVTAVSP